MKFYIAHTTNTNIFINHENKKYIVIEEGSPGIIYDKTFEAAIKSSKFVMEKFAEEKDFYISQCTLPSNADDLYNIISAAMSGMSGDDAFTAIRFEVIETYKVSKEQ